MMGDQRFLPMGISEINKWQIFYKSFLLISIRPDVTEFSSIISKDPKLCFQNRLILLFNNSFSVRRWRIQTFMNGMNGIKAWNIFLFYICGWRVPFIQTPGTCPVHNILIIINSKKMASFIQFVHFDWQTWVTCKQQLFTVFTTRTE